MLDAEVKHHYADHGWAWAKTVFTLAELEGLVAGTEEISAWQDTPGRWMAYYEQASGGKRLARLENFLPFHDDLSTLLLSDRVLILATECLGEPAILFKDKINFRPPGADGFTLHQDAPAYLAFGVTRLVTIMIPVDDFTMGNGCLDFSTGAAIRQLLPQNEDRSVSEGATASLAFRPVLARCGDLVVFDALVPHRSGRNTSLSSRRAYFLTFNAVSEGDQRERYFKEKRACFPPEGERIAGIDYGKVGAAFNLGNPYE